MPERLPRASFASAHEVQQAVHYGIQSQLMWGSDYPHVEGTFRIRMTHRCRPSPSFSLQSTFTDVAPADVVQMIGRNAIEVYDLDRDALERIATEIDAPTVKELRTPIEGIPEGASTHAFRSDETG